MLNLTDVEEKLRGARDIQGLAPRWVLLTTLESADGSKSASAVLLAINSTREQVRPPYLLSSLLLCTACSFSSRSSPPPAAL